MINSAYKIWYPDNQKEFEVTVAIIKEAIKNNARVLLLDNINHSKYKEHFNHNVYVTSYSNFKDLIGICKKYVNEEEVNVIIFNIDQLLEIDKEVKEYYVYDFLKGFIDGLHIDIYVKKVM